MFPLPIWLNFTLVYVGAYLALVLMNRRDFARDPPKAERYAALPLGFKLACQLIVLPMLAAVTIHTAFFALALVCAHILEAACVRWYRKAGLLL